MLARDSGAPGRAVLFCLAAAALLARPVAGAPAPAVSETVVSNAVQTVELSVGTAVELSFEAGIESAFVAEPETADVNVLDTRRLFVFGNAPGITSLLVYGPGGARVGAYAIRVSAQMEYVDTVVARIAGEASDVTVEPAGGALFVSGTAASPSEAEMLLRGIRAVAGVPVVDALSVATPPQVNLEVLISEVSRNVTRELGIDWSVDLNPFEHPLATWGTGTGSRLASGALRIANVYDEVIDFLNPDTGAVEATNEISELGVENPAPRGSKGGVVLTHSKEINSGKYRAQAFLDALAQNGLLVMHARPSLTTVSGQPAEFFSGLEIPVPSITDRGIVGTQYRQTGVSLVFTPTVLDRGQISLRVEPRVREVAAGGATIAGAVVPNINERSASATVELGDGESIAIAGLYGRNATATEAGLPLLKDIPIWGALFGSSRETDRSVELIIVVTVRIVAAGPAPGTTTRGAPGDGARQLSNMLYY